MIRAQIYKVYVAHIHFLRVLYKGKSADKTSNAFVLGIFLIAFNIHSLVAMIELSTNIKIGLISFWKPSSVPKAGLGYIWGFILSVIYMTLAQILGKSIPKRRRIQIMKEILVSKKYKTLAILYVIFSVLMFLMTVVFVIVENAIVSV